LNLFKGVPDAICDLLFEKYVATKKRSASGESGGSKKYALRELVNDIGFNTLNTNGIDVDKRFLARKDLVRKVIEETQLHEFNVIGSASATGKTSLLQLVMLELTADKNIKVCYMRGCDVFRARKNFGDQYL